MSLIRTAVVYRTEAQKVVDESEKVNYLDGDKMGASFLLLTITLTTALGWAIGDKDLWE